MPLNIFLEDKITNMPLSLLPSFFSLAFSQPGSEGVRKSEVAGVSAWGCLVGPAVWVARGNELRFVDGIGDDSGLRIQDVPCHLLRLTSTVLLRRV
jgi:hypothetical protein